MNVEQIRTVDNQQIRFCTNCLKQLLPTQLQGDVWFQGITIQGFLNGTWLYRMCSAEVYRHTTTIRNEDGTDVAILLLGLLQR